MSTVKDVCELIAEVGGSPGDRGKEDIRLAIQAVEKLLNTTGTTFPDICSAVEDAETRDQLAAAFKRFNAILRVLLEAFPDVEHKVMVLDAVKELRPSVRREVLHGGQRYRWTG